MKIAVYAGSFDPLTLGHLWVIKSGGKLFDRLHIAVTHNPDKNYLFSETERIEIISLVLQNLTEISNVSVGSIGKDYLAKHAIWLGARWALRGIRNEADYQNEVTMRDENNRINPNLETVCVFQPQELRGVSSSFVKSLVGPEGWEEVVKAHLPPEVYPIFVKQMRERRL